MVLALWLAVVTAADGPPALRIDDSRVTLGALAFGDVFPVSDQTVPGQPDQKQMSVYTGGRLLLGIDFDDPFTAELGTDLGYVASGLRPGNGNDGAMAGVLAGLEYRVHPLPVEALLRLRAQVLLQHWATSTGTLSGWAAQLQLGIRFWRVLEISALVGRDYAGGFAPGIGVGIGYF